MQHSVQCSSCCAIILVQLFKDYCCSAIVKTQLLQCNVHCAVASVALLEYEDLHTFAQVIFAYTNSVTYFWNFNCIACLIGVIVCLLHELP